MNIIVLKGNLTRDPEVREVNANGKPTKVANFTVAVSRYFKRKDGSKDKETTFMPCEAWDSGAETIGEILHKGDPVLITGSMKSESWEKDGVNHSRLKVRVDRFDKLNRSPIGASDDEGTVEVEDTSESEVKSKPKTKTKRSEELVGSAVEGEDIPF